MVQTNKILTVSYGTFSCTLEGFDESFETMKAIAEYFRDLAADDRYFGAEPPTPDAEMLARIAEKEISRRVEARFENDGIVLRPSLAAAADPATAPQPAPRSDSSEPAPAAAHDDAPVAETVAETDAPVETTRVPEVDAAPETETATEVETAEAQDEELAEAAAALSEPLSDIVEDTSGETAEDIAEDAPEAASAEEPVDIEEEAAETVEEVNAPAPFVSADVPETHARGEDPAIKAASPDKIPESIAEKLARIRAVVSSASASPARAPQDTPAEIAEAPDASATDPKIEETIEEVTETAPDAGILGNIMSTMASSDADDALTHDAPGAEELAEESQTPEAAIVEELAEDHEREVEAEDAEAPVEQDMIEAAETPAVEEYVAEETRAEEPAEAHTPVADLPFEIASEDDTAPQTETAAELDETPDAASVYDHDVAAKAGAADLDDAFDRDASDQADQSHETAEAEAAETDEAPVAPRRVAPRRPVRVVKVKRRQAQPEAAAQAQPEPAAPAMTDHGDSTLSPEDEADLMRELAEVEADNTPQAEAVADEAPQDVEELFEDTARTVRAMARRDRRDSFAEDEGDVSRLMAETDEQLEEPEGKSRRNAIAHLRAAVAATRADRGGETPQGGTEDRGEAYRDDLAKAVRPRRSTVETPQDRPRIAPLKLVAEQRVDLPEDVAAAAVAETAAQAVRPRRVSMPVDREEGPEAGGFAAFAEEVGASRLPELLEAAAAYMSFVEGRDQFSRPQLMTKVRQIERGDSSREDRLRSFGQLLRDGKIEKVQGGRFTASDSIRFRPDDRAAG